jgi:hypothetical protein
MVSESVHSALETLKAERERLDGAIASLQGLLGNGGGAGRGARRGRRRGPGRPRAPRAAGRRGRRSRKNAPRGLLKTKMHEALKRAGKPLGASKLRDAVIAAGYPVKNPKTLYTAIFNAVKKDTAIKKTKDGFALK